MASELQEAVERYLCLAVESLRPRPQLEHPGPVRLLTNPDRRVRDTVSVLEEGEVFRRLVTTTRRAFGSLPSGRDESLWKHLVQNFFRRSSLYLDAAADTIPSPDIVVASYITAFQRRERAVTYLAPIEHVYFPIDQMAFASFAVRRFKRDELAKLFQIPINRVFYPWALTEIPPLDDYWYIVLTKTIETDRPGEIRVNLADIDKVHRTFTTFPQVQHALLPLALFPWQADMWRRHTPWDKQEDWHGFRIPFLMAVDDDLLRHPRSRPDIGELDREPDFDPTTGVELDIDRPVIWTHFNKSETAEWQAFVSEMMTSLSALGLGSGDSQFFHRACGYLLKGFFSDGFEQLLWHITAVDALLGQGAGGATRRLSSRVAMILGTTLEQREAIRKIFIELYDFRSQFVHGANFSKQALTKHLWEARTIAQAVLVWFVRFSSHVNDVICRERLSPHTRDELLALIDIDMKARAIMGGLPEGFPAVPGWLANSPWGVE